MVHMFAQNSDKNRLKEASGGRTCNGKFIASLKYLWTAQSSKDNEKSYTETRLPRLH